MCVQPGDGELGSVGQAQFGEDGADAVADGSLAQEQRCGDRVVVQALGDQGSNFAFAFGQVVEGSLIRVNRFTMLVDCFRFD